MRRWGRRHRQAGLGFGGAQRINELAKGDELAESCIRELGLGWVFTGTIGYWRIQVQPAGCGWSGVRGDGEGSGRSFKDEGIRWVGDREENEEHRIV